MTAGLSAVLVLATITSVSGGEGPAQRPTAAGAPYPIDLATTLRLAGAHSVDVQIATNRLEAARALVTSATLRFVPWISAGTSYRRHAGLTQDVLGNIVTANKDLYALNGSLNLQVDVGDSIFRTLAAKQSRAAAEHALAAERQEAILRAAQGYFDLLTAQSNERVAAEALDISATYESQLHRAVDVGIALKGEELRARVQTERNRIALEQASEQRAIASARLAELLHLDAAMELIGQDVEMAPVDFVSTTEDVEGMLKEAWVARPEMKQAAANETAAAETSRAASYGPLIPTVTAQVSTGNLGGGRDGGPTDSGAARDYVAAVSWRIGPGGLFDSGRVKLAKARLSEAQWSLERLKDRISRQVVEARTRVRAEKEQVETAREALTAAEQALVLARGRKEFEVGVVLENILAEQDQTRARQDYARVLGEYAKAQYALLRALGRLDAPPVLSAIVQH